MIGYNCLWKLKNIVFLSDIVIRNIVQALFCPWHDEQ